MKDAIKLLFETEFNGNHLFSSQLDLVNSLLKEPKSKYFTSQSDSETFSKVQNRLKAYLSQLLSVSVVRNLNEDFLSSLRSVLMSKLNEDSKAVEKIIEKLVQDIRDKNSSVANSELKSIPLDQFIPDLNSGKYIVVITSRPLEIEVQPSSGVLSLRQILFGDLIDQLYDENREIKSYRFNFPTEAFCDLFWRGLKKILFKKFKDNITAELLDSLRSKLGLTIDIPSVIEDEHVDQLVHDTLRALNNRKNILVFITVAPIYGLPLVAIDPSKATSSKIYYILDNERMNLFKFPENESLLWRLFVWDTLKSKKYAGVNVPYFIEN